MKKLLLAVSVTIRFALATPCLALSVPERLVYDISWTGIPAGTTVQDVNREGADLHIVSTTRSAPWLRLFFPVDDRVEAVLAPSSSPGKLGLPRWYRERTNEGSRHTLKDVRFDQARRVAVTTDLLHKSEKSDPIGELTYDSLSCVYYVREAKLVPGHSLHINIFDCKHLWNTEIKVLRREEVSTPVGTFKTIVVKPLLKSPGFFARTGDVLVWLTDDARRIPVKMTTAVKIGSITATLVGGSYWPEHKK